MGDSERCSNKVAIHSSFVSGLFRDCLDRPGPGEDSAHRGLWRFFGLPPCKLTSSGDKVREAYIEFFRDKKEHDFIASSPVVPLNDPTLLFANAGMNQFKPIFLGQLEPNSPLQGVARAVNSQKCIRAGGKHNDLDDVGKDVYHHTFFEMLGNWSFGDYFKEEAINWAWELLTEVYGLDPERLYASYFAGDEELGLPADVEAKEMWEKLLPPERVLPFDRKDNFWEMGATGPCGPCSELHYDRLGGRDAAALVNADDPDVIEIWNLVFMQFYREDDGTLTELPSRHIDTGMGLERVTSVLQDKRSNYDTDIFGPLLAALHDLVGGDPYQGRVGEEDVGMRDTAYRIIVDHARTLTLAVVDGAMPSSEGRGYVLRRILRRAVRYGRSKLQAPPGFFSQLVPKVADCLGVAFPELNEGAKRVESVLREEEAAFDRTVDRGMQFFEALRDELTAEGKSIIPGDQAFLLYDTHGFPLDLTEQMAQEAGFTLDSAGFEAAMEKQKERSREALREQQAQKSEGLQPLELVAEQTAWLGDRKVPITDDDPKYTWNTQPSASILAIYTEHGFVESTADIKDDGASVGLVLDKTPFYAEAGGQVNDLGLLRKDDGAELDVKVVQAFAGYVLHTGPLPTGALSVGDEVVCQVDYAHRSRIAPNHTMTHVLNWALREVLGDGIDQRGSLVTAERLRFDFSYEASNGVSVKDLQLVESKVREVVDSALPVHTKTVALADAQAIAGLRAMAGESYPDPVRVVTVGSADLDTILEKPGDSQWLTQSVEFCGGTHISSTSEAKSFALLEERGISKGVRRIIAATGEAAEIAMKEAEQLDSKVTELEGSKDMKEEALIQLSRSVDNSELPAAPKAALRDRLGQLRKQLKKKQKKKKGKVSKEDQAAFLAELRQAIEAARSAGADFCVATFEGSGVDGKMLRDLASEPEMESLAVLVLNQPSDGAVDCLAAVPSSLQASKPAGAWVKAALDAVGGKGGGKPAFAQGAARGTDSQALSAARAAAEAFWAS
ncbi:ALATS [Symbiodinium natans]|uniref:Alanine--tRNA ligase n=1 Tax=Symbiodinium natans TaxID=878477 RepID=A0A812HQM6_9DINO|nr:ALATS [Symbiodinium natans]